MHIRLQSYGRQAVQPSALQLETMDMAATFLVLGCQKMKQQRRHFGGRLCQLVSPASWWLRHTQSGCPPSLWEMRQHLEPSKKGRCGNRGTTRPRMELPPSWVPSGAALATSLSRILYRSWRGRSRTACPTSVMSYALLNKSGKSSKSGESLKSGKSSNAR